MSTPIKRIGNFVSKAMLVVLGLGSDVITANTLDYFSRSREPRIEPVEDLICESALTVLGGDYGIGKSPVLADLVVHITNGVDWCGRKVEKRPVIHFDFETPSNVYKTNLENGAARLGVERPKVPDMLNPFFWHDDVNEGNREKLLAACESREASLSLIIEELESKPNAVVLIDPVEIFFTLDKNKGVEVVRLFRQLHKILTSFPHAGMLGTFNLKKVPRNPKLGPSPDLLADPRGWLDEVSGAKEIMSRSDIRLGIDFQKGSDTIRVINGVKRGEPFDPLLIEPAGNPEAGFEPCPAGRVPLKLILSTGQMEHWEKLPQRFTFKEGELIVPHSTLHRIIDRARTVGFLRKEGDAWVKPRV